MMAAKEWYAPWVEHVRQVDMRLGQPRNRVVEARTFFFCLAAAAGLGTYRRGVRGQTTPLELAADIAERIGPLLERPVEALQRPTEAADAPEQSRAEVRATPALEVGLPARQQAGIPALSITVDMTDRDLERIAAFLKLIGYPVVE